MSQTRDLSIDQAAAVYRVTPRAMRLGAQRCLDGGTYHGLRLAVVVQEGVRGRGGRRLLVKLDSLPVDLRQRALELFPELAAAPAGRPVRPTRPGKTGRGNDRKPRTPIGRRWNAEIDLPEPVKAEIAAKADRKCRSFWAGRAGYVGWRRVAQALSIYLFRECRAAGSELPDAVLRDICEVPRRFVGDRKVHKRVNTYRHDKKAFFDACPNVERERPGRPLEVIVGDGTPIDIGALRPDGEPLKAALIAWADPYSNRIFAHVYPRPKGRGVTQKHVACSYAVLVSEIGAPEAVYIDRGSEYAWVSQLEEAGLARVVKSRAYAARSKIIEPLFRVLGTNFLSQIDGYLGSDRMTKPTQTRGKPTKPFSGTLQEFLGQIRRAIEHYNATPQAGLGDRSPNQVWQAALDAGWRPKGVDLQTLAEVIGSRKECTVTRGFVRFDKKRFTSDRLCRFEYDKAKVSVIVPMLGDFPPSVYDEKGRFIDLVYEKQRGKFLDPAGAKEAKRLEKIWNRSAAELADQAPPEDPGPYIDAYLEANPAPEDAVPGELLELDGDQARAVAARRLLENHGLEIAGDAPALPAPEEGSEPDFYGLLRLKKRSAS